ncbi:divalent cation tolerance protein CutA [Colwellia sp. 20A7]|uniref:divalent cation tolerance protein CutA n=1 Tax=Colwellia sp. 20A7 TaxID=2689569 RepID=UPI0013589870
MNDKRKKYRYKNKLQLLIKTKSDNLIQLNARISNLHRYNVAETNVIEVIALNIQQSNKHYLNWISEN